jgi:hypothetical protein
MTNLNEIKAQVQRIVEIIYGDNARVLDVTENESLTIRNIYGYQEAVIHDILYREEGDTSTIMLDQKDISDDISMMQHRFDATYKFKNSFTLFDNGEGKEELNGSVEIDGTSWVNISLNGFSTATAEESEIIVLELYEGKPMLRVWADINEEDPTHNIDLSGALISKKIERI